MTSGGHSVPSMNSSLLLIASFIIATSYASEMGVSLGSTAAGSLATYGVRNLLRQPRQVRLELQSGVNPWFEPIAHVDTKNRLTFDSLTIQFVDNVADARLNNVTLRSASKIHLLPLPFFLGEDTAHIKADAAQIQLRMKMDNFNVKLDECKIDQSSVDIVLEHSYILNFLMDPVQRFLPQSLIHDALCNSIAESLSTLRSRFVFEIPLSKVIPEKFLAYMKHPNTTIYTQLQAIEARDEKLTISAKIEWQEADTRVSDDRASDKANEDTQGNGIDERTQSKTSGKLAGRSSSSERQDGLRVFEPMERLQLWVEDKLINEVFNRFRWDFEWMNEDIPVESPKLPASTREFLTTLCTNCYFELRVSANGPPRVTSANSSIVLEKSDKIILKVVNPSRNLTSVFVSFGLKLGVQLRPQIEGGIFRTEVDLLETHINMEKGAFPKGWNSFAEDLVKGMIMDVIWPNLKTEIQKLTYADGVQIPDDCGLEPRSAQLHFDEGRFGASAVLLLEDASLGQCVQQLRSKLPDPSRLFVIKETL